MTQDCQSMREIDSGLLGVESLFLNDSMLLTSILLDQNRMNSYDVGFYQNGGANQTSEFRVKFLRLSVDFQIHSRFLETAPHCIH
jgi:hypothetical protein